MGIVDKVGDEVLSDLVATMHPYQSFYPKGERSYDRNPKSLAYVAPGDEGLTITLVVSMEVLQRGSLKCLRSSQIV